MKSTSSQERDDLPETTESVRSSHAPRTRQTPHGFEQRLLERARAAGLVSGDRVVVGFSGGRDSLALAAAMRRLRKVLSIEPLLVHVDHGLRPSSAEDATRAAGHAAELGFALGIVRVSAQPVVLHPGVGVEEAARRERYRVLFDEATKGGALAVVTAHHQSDQAETVLLHLLRGGGVHGAAAMSERSPMPTGEGLRTTASDISREAETPWLWRPMLGETRAVIDAYVSELGLIPIEDPSNADATLRRNALRREILPLLEARFPGATAAFARYAMLAAEDDRLLEDLAGAVLNDATDPDGHLVTARMREEPLALQRRVVRQWLLRTTGSRAFSADRTEAVVALLRAGSGRTIEIGEGWTVRNEGGMLRLAKLGSDPVGSEG